MQRSTVVLMVIAAALVASAVGAFLYANVMIVEVQQLPIDFQVDNLVGLNVDTDALHMGRMMPGGNAQRGITISHKKGSTLYARLSVVGEAAPYITITPQRLEVPRGLDKEVRFDADIPEDMPYGNYTGVVRIVFRRMP
ncbi:MAG: hypothetical protein V1735_03950 [Nanoarchaeota archaeon]